jgi:nucleotide-binding universal stress UspA family protein
MTSILVHLYDDDGLEARLQAAFDLARALNGRLICLHATPYEDYLAADPVVAMALPVEFSGKMKRLRETFQERVEARLESEGVRWDWVHVDERMSDALIHRSALADLVVTSFGRRAVERRDARPLAATVAMGGRAPVVAVPDSLDRLALDRPVVVAWNGSAEAATALRGAMPILRLAPAVHLVQVVEDLSINLVDDAARYLSGHGISAGIVQREDLDRDAAALIRQAAFDLGAGLIVMGAYGRSRLRELLLGGVTRDMLRESTLPLLLAH